MKEDSELEKPGDETFHEEHKTDCPDQRASRCGLFAAVFGFAGAACCVVGGVLTAITWFAGSGTFAADLRTTGTILLCLTIPFLFLCAHCLDLADRSRSRVSGPHYTAIKAVSHRNYRLHLTTIAVFVTLLFHLPANTCAQQTVFNVPTTDVLDPGKVYLELDVSAKPNDPQFSSFVPRVVVGVGGNVEVGLNVLGNIQPGTDATTLAPAVKWKIYSNEDNGLAIAVGNNLFIPVRNKSYRLGTYSYTTIQKTFKTRTRIGFGGYFFGKNVVAPNANRAGGQFTFEQSVTPRFGLQADWFTGKHASGYFTPGGYFKFTRKMTGYGAYSIGNANAANGNHFLYFEVGYNIN